MTAALDAPTLRRAMWMYGEALRQHRDELNSLNVYPVPDGDTGTNMLLTQEAVLAAIDSSDDGTTDLATLGREIGHASLMGARGNSGVILSQVLRGICDALGDSQVHAKELATALIGASDAAYRAVARPAEGTMLSVLRDAAREANAAADAGADLPAVAEASLRAARTSLASTREILPALKEAGMIDAGGKGIVLLLDAIRAALRDGLLSRLESDLGPIGGAAVQSPEPSPFHFEVQFMLEASEQRVATLRRRLAELGDSLVVVGGGGVYNVHLHTDHAGQSVEAALEAGRPRDISITALAGAAPSCIGGGAREVRVGEQACATVAMAAGDGLVRTLRSLGAIVVEEERPSVRALVAAIQSAPSLEVLVLPNGENSLVAARLAAEQVRPGTGPLDQRRVERTNKTVVVLETPSIPAGIAAATAFNPALRLEDNRSTMWAAAARCRSGEVRRADRDETTAAGAVSAGGWVGLAEGEVVHTSHSCPETVAAVIDRLAGSDSEIVTLFPGAGTRDEEVAVAEMAAQRYTRLEVQIVEGGQPAPRFLIGVE